MTAVDRSRLAALHEAGQIAGAPLDLPDLLRQTVESAVRLAAAGRGFLALANKNTGDLEVRAAHGLSPEEAAELAGVAGAAAAAERGFVIADSRGDARYPASAPPASAMAARLHARGRTVGALVVDRGLPQGAFSPDDLLLLEIFADQAGLAIEAGLSKGDFVSVVTHELRLPMTPIKGYTDLLRSGVMGPVSEQQKEILNTIRNNVDRMNALVSDLADMSKLELGRLKVDVRAVDPADCLDEVLHSTRPQIEARGQTLRVDLPAVRSLPPVLVDRSRLVQNIANLIVNASAYTPAEGHIVVEAEARDGFVCFAVSDTGIGISPDDRARLFHPFFRSEHPAVREHHGWGLSLHVTKRLVELFGGQIGAESEADKGSRFWFTVPVYAE